MNECSSLITKNANLFKTFLKIIKFLITLEEKKLFNQQYKCEKYAKSFINFGECVKIGAKFHSNWKFSKYDLHLSSEINSNRCYVLRFIQGVSVMRPDNSGGGYMGQNKEKNSYKHMS